MNYFGRGRPHISAAKPPALSIDLLSHITLGQSPTQQHAYTIFVYAIPLIVCTNIWCHEDPWLQANSIYVEVDSKLWRDELAIQDAPAH